MVPINVEVPKGILEVHGEPLIERLIRQLLEAGVKEIDIVVGFMKEQYEYLIDKYGVHLVFNKDYAVKNNLYSLKQVLHKIGRASSEILISSRATYGAGKIHFQIGNGIPGIW